MTKASVPCAHCDEPVPQPLVGRPKRFCGPNCKQANWRKTHKPEVRPEPETVDDIPLDDDQIDLDSIPLLELRQQAVARGLSPTGNRESLIQRILIDDGVELIDDDVEPEPTPAPRPRWLADPAAPSPRSAPTPRGRLREAW